MTRRCESPNSIPSLNKSLLGAVCKSLANCTHKWLSSVLEEKLSWTGRKSSIICGYLGYHTKLTINGTWNWESPSSRCICTHLLSIFLLRRANRVYIFHYFKRRQTLLWASVCRITFLSNVFPKVCFDMMQPGLRDP